MFGRKTIVFFDLKTTDLNIRSCHVIQLSAVRGGTVFNEYSLPLRRIHPEAHRLNGFSVRNDRLYHLGEEMETVPLRRLLTSLIDFLSDLPRPVLLAAHRATAFDVPILMRLLRRFRLEGPFRRVVSGFLDTFTLSRSLPDDLERRSLSALAQHFLEYDYDDNGPHDAVDDAVILQDLFYWWTSDRWDFPTFQ